MAAVAENCPPRGRRWKRVAASAAVAAMGLVAAVMIWRATRPVPVDRGEAHDVPLGVEEAVIVRCAGPRLVARPYRRGASINVRISAAVRRGSTRVYDIRYVVNLPGTFDLTDYLATADGSPLDDLSPFLVRGETRLTKDIETRIREIEDVGVHIGHGYYETLFGLGVFWVLWLLGLVFIGRSRRIPQREERPAPPPLVEQIESCLELLRRGPLSVADQAQLEALLLQYWREAMPDQAATLAAACREMARDERRGKAYRLLQSWMHDPQADIQPGRILAECDPRRSPATGTQGAAP